MKKYGGGSVNRVMKNYRLVNNTEYLWIVCACSSNEHVVRFALCKDPEWWDLYMSVHLAKKGFWHRLWHGIKYIFGYSCLYGDFDELHITLEDAKAMRELLNQYIEFGEKDD